jgi:metal-responsive CopG/Arc/MetJ family transcriptional regulator
MENQIVNMSYPKKLLERIDALKNGKGFATRTQTVIFLLQLALDKPSCKLSGRK